MDPVGCLMMVEEEDFLNFSSDIGEEDDEEDKTKALSPSSLETNTDDNRTCLFPELGEKNLELEMGEEELEWLSNKDAFPEVETCFDLAPNNSNPLEYEDATAKQQSPVSVLDSCSSRSATNSNSNSSSITSCFGSVVVPRAYRSRSERRRREQCWRWSQANFKNVKQEHSLLRRHSPTSASSSSSVVVIQSIGRRCQHCQAEKTPQWRAGPMGPKTLCNACGVRYKSGRLVPEYRPASSPTFSSVLHSNSHRKVMEMRKMKHLGGPVMNDPCGYRVGA